MTSSAFMYSSKDSTAKKVKSVPTILLGIDYEWSLIFLWDISASRRQERVSPFSRVAQFARPTGPEKNEKTTCNLDGEGCVTIQKGVGVRHNNAWYK